MTKDLLPGNMADYTQFTDRYPHRSKVDYSKKLAELVSTMPNSKIVWTRKNFNQLGDQLAIFCTSSRDELGQVKAYLESNGSDQADW